MNFAIKGHEYLIWFGMAILFIYVPCMYLWLKRRKNRAVAYEHEHPEAVKVYFRRIEMDDTLNIISVNGEKPVVHSKGTKYGFYLLPGENIIHVRCQWANRSATALSGYKTHTIEDEKLKVIVETNKTYSLSCNRKLQQFEFKEA